MNRSDNSGFPTEPCFQTGIEIEPEFIPAGVIDAIGTAGKKVALLADAGLSPSIYLRHVQRAAQAALYLGKNFPPSAILRGAVPR